ncbi:MAG: hydroxypyruvate isomerase family protein [Saccharofermentanales bacterium]
MTKFSLCIEPVLTEFDFYDRIKIAAEQGFDAIEFWDPDGKDIGKISRIAAASDIAVSICCVNKAWDLRMSFPGEIVIENIRKSISIAKELGCSSLIGLSGDVDEGSSCESQIADLTNNLASVADLLAKADITLCLEALNSLVDHKGYFLDSSKTGFDIIRKVGSDNVKLLYDVYHMQIMEGNIIENITENSELIGHFHSAGVPGRNEHFNGENDYNNILKAVVKSGYDRYFGLEYWTTYDAKKSLADCLEYLKR